MRAIYKLGQGYWTRLISVLSFGILVAAGAVWLWQQTSVTNNVYIQGSAAAGLAVVGGLLLYWLFGVNRTAVDFFIATEGELKKVNWSTRREVIGSTWVVIIVAMFISALLFVVDIFFKEIFQMVGVLAGDSAFLGFIKGLFSSAS